MKKLLMIVAAMTLGTASAAGSTGALSVTVNATVVNVCTIGSTTTTAQGVTASATATLPTYNALSTSSTTVNSTPTYLRCTKGTNLTVTPGSGSMTLNSASTGGQLNVGYSATVSSPMSMSDGDHFTGSATFTALPGQWTAPAATDYTGIKTFTVSWN